MVASAFLLGLEVFLSEPTISNLRTDRGVARTSFDVPTAKSSLQLTIPKSARRTAAILKFVDKSIIRPVNWLHYYYVCEGLRHPILIGEGLLQQRVQGEEGVGRQIIRFEEGQAPVPEGQIKK